MIQALLIGREPDRGLPYTYVQEPPYEAVVVGSLPLSQALRLTDDRILQALAEGKSVILYTPGLPTAPGNRGLSAALAASRREMKVWGIVFTDGTQRKLATSAPASFAPSATASAMASVFPVPLQKTIATLLI